MSLYPGRAVWRQWCGQTCSRLASSWLVFWLSSSNQWFSRAGSPLSSVTPPRAADSTYGSELWHDWQVQECIFKHFLMLCPTLSASIQTLWGDTHSGASQWEGRSSGPAYMALIKLRCRDTYHASPCSMLKCEHCTKIILGFTLKEMRCITKPFCVYMCLFVSFQGFVY